MILYPLLYLDITCYIWPPFLLKKKERKGGGPLGINPPFTERNNLNSSWSMATKIEWLSCVQSMVDLLGILYKARNNLRARDLGDSREVGCQWWCPSWRHPVMIPGPGAWMLFSGFSLTTGTHQLSRHTRPLAPSSLTPTAIPLPLLIHFSSSADSSPGPRDCLFWSERLYCLFPSAIHLVISPFTLPDSSLVSPPCRLP